jgi:hypothetical protein
MAIEAHIPFLEEILGQWKNEIGKDYQGYKNHVYRMINFCFALHDCDEEARQKIIIAGCFPDIGIWTADTFDYLPPSIAQSTSYLKQSGLEQWRNEIELMIGFHHKVRKHGDEDSPLVEVFRKGDLVDFSLGIINCGLQGSYVKGVKNHFPNAGFHKRLVQLELGWFTRHPFNPLPVFKW